VLGAFLGLTGYFRNLIKGYAKIAQPLLDLVKAAEIPRKNGKGIYRRAMCSHTLEKSWGSKEQCTFLSLKIALTQEPVLKGPKFDGTPFIVTMDGSKFGFAGMLSQWHTTVDADGKTIRRLHPVGLASKRTSSSEEWYKPFLLEFAVLKYSLDKFSDLIEGFPVELETDCQALQDHLLNDRLSATHARWREVVLNHQIVDVRHRPGKDNVVADGLSRRFMGASLTRGDGHEWTVCEDWEARTGLTHAFFHIAEESQYSDLLTRFKDENIFWQVIEALLKLDHRTSLRERRQAPHRALDLYIEDNKLWKLGLSRCAGGIAWSA
jgi:hypothetical protein